MCNEILLSLEKDEKSTISVSEKLGFKPTQGFAKLPGDVNRLTVNSGGFVS